MTNEDVLEAVKQVAPIILTIKYTNIWIDGRHTYLRNGDQFFYVAEEEVTKFSKSLLIWDIKARVIKPVVYTRCSRCDQQGHRSSSPDCPALAPPEVQESTEAFRGTSHPLSNLHVCPEGCTWTNEDDLVMKSSEHEYQFEKLVAHGLADNAEWLLSEDFAVDVMHSVNAHIAEESMVWQERKYTIMERACRKKFLHCPHAKDVLLKSKSELAESTLNMEWGTGLDLRRTIETNPDFWPSKNMLGKILKCIRGDLLEEIHLQQIDSSRTEKRKTVSPLVATYLKKQAVE